MKGREVLDVVAAAGVHTLYHANTTTTACTFLRTGSLLSREAVERLGLKQTPQRSDALDKRLGIWNDIFLDGVDVHYRGGEKNHYGPVCFEFDARSLLTDALLADAVLVTKKNPVHWVAEEPSSARYFESGGELKEGYSFGDFGKHLILRIQEGRLPLVPHLRRIVVDDPKRMLESRSLYERAITDLTKAAAEGGIEVTFAAHGCKSTCRCVSTYAKFHPKALNIFWE